MGRYIQGRQSKYSDVLADAGMGHETQTMNRQYNLRVLEPQYLLAELARRPTPAFSRASVDVHDRHQPTLHNFSHATMRGRLWKYPRYRRCENAR